MPLPTVEISTSLIDLISSLKALGGSARRPTEPGDTPPHEDCRCPACQIARFELPVPAVGSDAVTEAIRDLFMDMHRNANRAAQAGADTSSKLVFEPLPPELERTSGGSSTATPSTSCA
jgi:hypothetical protein